MSKKSFLIIAAFVFLLVFQTSCQKKMIQMTSR